MGTGANHIEVHALIGDVCTAAPGAADGCIDWHAFPRFDAAGR